MPPNSFLGRLILKLFARIIYQFIWEKYLRDAWGPLWIHRSAVLMFVGPGPLRLWGKLWHLVHVLCPWFCRLAQEVTNSLSPPMASGWEAAPHHRELSPWTPHTTPPMRRGFPRTTLSHMVVARAEQSGGRRSCGTLPSTLWGLLRDWGGSLFQGDLCFCFLRNWFTFIYVSLSSYSEII